MSAALDFLVNLLDLEPIEVNIFRGVSPNEDRQRVFGGQVAAQALMAAGRTVEIGRPHSLHAYFLRPGDPTVPILYDVDRIRDGRSFTTRRVVAIQHGRAIFNLSASFHVDEDGLSHQFTMPDVPPPEELESLATRLEPYRQILEDWFSRPHPIEQRHIGDLPFIHSSGRAGSGSGGSAAGGSGAGSGSGGSGSGASGAGGSGSGGSGSGGSGSGGSGPGGSGSESGASGAGIGPYQQLWIRADGTLPDDPLLHACIAAYASDMSLFDTMLAPHDVRWDDPDFMGASLDHCMWFHRPFRADEWLLYDMDSPSAYGARGLARGFMFTRGGELVVSMAQEGLMRARAAR